MITAALLIVTVHLVITSKTAYGLANASSENCLLSPETYGPFRKYSSNFAIRTQCYKTFTAVIYKC
jgi:hypothetical protein